MCLVYAQKGMHRLKQQQHLRNCQHNVIRSLFQRCVSLGERETTIFHLRTLVLRIALSPIGYLKADRTALAVRRGEADDEKRVRVSDRGRTAIPFGRNDRQFPTVISTNTSSGSMSIDVSINARNPKYRILDQ